MNHLSDLSLTHIQPLSDTAPVVIGGIGGSGTRVVAGLLQQLGFDIGSDLNDSLDDLSFTALFKRPALWPLCEHIEQLTVALATYLTARGHPTPHEVTAADQSGRAQLLLNDIDSEIAWQEVGTLQDRSASLCAIGTGQSSWGWKEPNTHIVLPFLLAALPNMRYIHVIRHGVDMAFSRNQTQVALWGAGLAAGDGDERSRSMTYWCHVQERMQQLSELYPGRIHWLKLESLFDNPAATANGLCNFLQAPQLLESLQDACGLVKQPSTLGRYKTQPALQLPQSQLSTLQDLGYSYP